MAYYDDHCEWVSTNSTRWYEGNSFNVRLPTNIRQCFVPYFYFLNCDVIFFILLSWNFLAYVWQIRRVYILWLVAYFFLFRLCHESEPLGILERNPLTQLNTPFGHVIIISLYVFDFPTIISIIIQKKLISEAIIFYIL